VAQQDSEGVADRRRGWAGGGGGSVVDGTATGVEARGHEGGGSRGWTGYRDRDERGRQRQADGCMMRDGRVRALSPSKCDIPLFLAIDC
jgi:hypothetical protein